MHDDRVRMLTTSVKPTKGLTQVINDIMANSPHIQTVRSVTAGTVVFSWQAVSPNLVRAGQQAGGNALGLEAVSQFWFHIDLLWRFAEDDDTVRVAGESMLEEIEAAAKAEGSHVRYIFMSNANERQPVIASYGADSLRRMWDVQARYDPRWVFRRLVSSAFKIPEREGHPAQAADL